MRAVDPGNNTRNRGGRPRGVKNRTAAALDSGEISALIEWGDRVADRFPGFHGFQPLGKSSLAPFYVVSGKVRATRSISFGRAVRFVDDVIARLRDEHKVPAAEAEEVRRSAPLWLRVDEPDVRDKRYASAVRKLLPNDDVRNAENDQYPTPPIGYSAVHVPIIVAWLVEISSRVGVRKAAQAKLRAEFTKELELARPAAWEKFGEMLAAHGWGPVDSADAIGTIEQVPPKAEA